VIASILEKVKVALLNILKNLLLRLVWIYQKAISPFFAPSCRFHPTCSTYMMQAINLHGPFIGTWLGLKRISRCHPLNSGGVDNVPEAIEDVIKET
jgi:hypothetical protein